MCRRRQVAHASLASKTTSALSGILSDDCIPGSPFADKVFGRTVPPSSKDPAALARIRQWIDDCNEGHQHHCPSKPQLPTRILQIGKAGTQVRLRKSKDTKGNYVALSHCWGAAQPANLNRDTVDGLLAGIKTDTLPQSFQDAV